MRRTCGTAVLGMLALVAGVSLAEARQAAATPEVIAGIHVHGNHVTTNEEILTLAGVAVGMPFAADTLAVVERRLRASGKFETVEILKRFASISDPSRITLVIIVNEGPVRIRFDRAPDGERVARVVRRTGFRNLMFLPILDAQDGYGLTYGVTSSMARVTGNRSRLSVPLSWGGTKRAAVELEKNFVTGLVTRVELGAAVQRRTNPAFEIDDDRQQVWARAERAMGPVRLGGTAGWQRVTFAEIQDEFRSIGADVVVDTRLDPTFPRHAVLASARWERLTFDAGHTLHRTRLEARGYLGLVRQTVLALRVTREGANGPQPRYLQPLMGGWSSLRGFEAGRFAGDIVVTGSAELLVPLRSPLSSGRLGISAFVDTGVAYLHGQRFRDQTRQTGIGGSVWMTARVFRLSLSVAHGRGASTRVNFGGGLTF